MDKKSLSQNSLIRDRMVRFLLRLTALCYEQVFPLMWGDAFFDWQKRWGRLSEN